MAFSQLLLWFHLQCRTGDSLSATDDMYVAHGLLFGPLQVVRMVNASTGIISTVAGTGEAGFSGDGGPATKAALDFPAGMAFDAQGRLLIADMNNHVVRRLGTDGIISTFAGTPGSAGFGGDGAAATSAQLSSPADLSVDAEGGVIIADSDNNKIRRIDAAGVISTIAGSSAGYGGDGGPALQAQFDAPQGVAVRPDGAIYVADAKNQRVRLLQCV
jgi:DNA-binding beta-propeller fold protein YncE